MPLLLAGCGDSGPVALPGVYTLYAIGIQPPPVVIVADSQFIVEASAGTVTLLSDSTFIDARVYLVTPTGAAPTTESDTLVGTYSRNGDKVNLVATGGSTYQLVWEGRRLVRYAEGFTFRYQK